MSLRKILVQYLGTCLKLPKPERDVTLITTEDGRRYVEVVRCRDCLSYYEVENYHPSGNYVMRCCKYFDTYNDEVKPDGFCAWGERKAVKR